MPWPGSGRTEARYRFTAGSRAVDRGMLVDMSEWMCEHCGVGFDRSDDLERHRAEAHPDATTHAVDVEQAVVGLRFPLGREDLLDHLRTADPTMADRLRALPDQNYTDARDVARVYDALHGNRDGAGWQR